MFFIDTASINPTAEPEKLYEHEIAKLRIEHLIVTQTIEIERWWEGQRVVVGVFKPPSET